jgi:hypothetical protein
VSRVLRSVLHIALDGSRIEVRTSLDVSRPFSSFANLRIGSHLQEFGAGDRDFALANAWDVGVRAFPETYRFQGGTLRLGTAAQFERTIKARSELLFAVWEGERHSLYTFAYNATSSSDLLAVLGRVRLTESPEGLAMAPTKPADTPMSDVCLAKDLPTLGLLQIHPAEYARDQGLPRWRGRQVAGGELFVNQDDPTRRWFVLSGRTALTHVIPDPDRDPNALLPALAELQVERT